MLGLERAIGHMMSLGSPEPTHLYFFPGLQIPSWNYLEKIFNETKHNGGPNFISPTNIRITTTTVFLK